MMKRQIPNMLTMLRLVLAGVFFGLLNQYRYVGLGEGQAGVLIGALIVFVIAALTDALDGYLARRWQVISVFGRIMDPLADKILILGAYIYLAGPRMAIGDGSGDQISGVYPWMAVVILFRELFVTSIRAALESSGVDFSAKWSGKIKMILQAISVPVVLVAMMMDPASNRLWAMVRDVAVWATVAATIISGVPYGINAVKAVKRMGG